MFSSCLLHGSIATASHMMVEKEPPGKTYVEKSHVPPYHMTKTKPPGAGGRTGVGLGGPYVRLVQAVHTRPAMHLRRVSSSGYCSSKDTETAARLWIRRHLKLAFEVEMAIPMSQT